MSWLQEAQPLPMGPSAQLPAGVFPPGSRPLLQERVLSPEAPFRGRERPSQQTAGLSPPDPSLRPDWDAQWGLASGAEGLLGPAT